MGSHQSAKAQTDTWLTPPHVIDALAPFDLDPCAAPWWHTARTHYILPDDGLELPWHGFVWCNPPYGRETGRWLKRMCEHDNGISLIFARTETRMFFEWVWQRASAVLFLQGRLHFHYPDGRRSPTNSGAPSCLVAYGDTAVERLRASGLPGAFVDLTQTR